MKILPFPFTIVLALTLATVHARAAGIPLHDLPSSDPLIATLLTQISAPEFACLHKKAKDRKIEIFDDRPKLPYRYVRGEKSRGLAVVLPGFAASIRSYSGAGLAEIFCKKGLTVVVLPSTFHRTFILSAATADEPGPVPVDVADTLRAIRLIVTQLEEDRGAAFSSKYLAGASLGGLHALAIESILKGGQDASLRFDRTIVAHPAVDVDESVRILDSFNAIPADWPVEGRHAHIQDVLERALGALSQPDEAPPTFTADEMKFLIGLSFHTDLEDAVLSSGERLGKIKVKATSSQRTALMAKVSRITFETYFEHFVLPAERLRQKNPTLSADRLREQSSLSFYLGGLNHDASVRVFHAHDDPVTGERSHAILQKLAQELGESQIKVFDHGGHLGTYLSPAAVEEIAREVD